MQKMLSRIQSKKIQVCIIGLGYVGLPLALRFAEAQVKVVGFDIDRSKIDTLLSGKSYLKHLNHDHAAKAIKSGFFFPTDRYEEISSCDAVIICVPTPLDEHLAPDLSYITESCKALLPYLKSPVLISLESTTYPGTTEEIVLPILESSGTHQNGKNLYLCFSPEREDPGNPHFNTKTIPKIIGGVTPEALTLGHALYSLAIEKVIEVSSAKVAEATKIYENIFRSVNIALVNELKMIFDAMDIDIWEVLKGAQTKPFGFMPFWPGPGLGGHCIPIDPYYLSWKAKQYGITTRFIELAGQINREVTHWVLRKIQDCLNQFNKPLKDARVLILGLSYKPNIDDIRESPSLKLLELLKEKGAIVSYHDPYIPFIPNTREYKEFKGQPSCPPSKEYDCFVLVTHHSIFSTEELLSYHVPIVDTRNFFAKNKGVFPA